MVLTILLSAGLVAPIWMVDLLPLVDAGSHLHLITILHGLNLPVFAKHYNKVHAIVPYISYYAAVDWLAYLRDVEWANRVVLTACLLAIPLASISLLRAAGHSRWLVLGVLPWLLNADFFMGFFNFLMSLPLFLWLMAAHLRYLRSPSRLRALQVVAWLCALATTHYLLWSAALLLIPLLALVFGARQSWRQALVWPIRDGLLGLPSVGVLLPWFMKYFVFSEGVVTSDAASVSHKGTFWQRLTNVYAGEHLGPVDNLRQVADRLFDTVGPQQAPPMLGSQPGQLVTLLWLFGLVLWIAASIAQRHARPHEPLHPLPLGRWKVDGSAYTGWLLGLTSGLYFVFPQHLLKPIWLHGVNFRMIELLAILAVVALPLRPLEPVPKRQLRMWIGMLCMIAASIVLARTTWRSFQGAQTEFDSIRQAYGRIPEGKAVLTLRSKRKSQWFRYHIFNGIGEYYGVLRRGYVPYSFADTSSKPVVINRDTAIPAPPWDAQEQFTWRDHGRYYDYIALYDDLGSGPPPWQDELPKDLVEIYHHGRWRILRNLSPDPWPQPTPAQWTKIAERYAQQRVEIHLISHALSERGLGELAVDLREPTAGPWLEAMPGRLPKLKDAAVLGVELTPLWPHVPLPSWSAPEPHRPSLRGRSGRLLAPIVEPAPGHTTGTPDADE